MKYEKYFHHKKDVSVRADLKGKHREHCLCYDCDMWPECEIREEVFGVCVRHNIVAPVWECPGFYPLRKNSDSLGDYLARRVGQAAQVDGD